LKFDWIGWRKGAILSVAAGFSQISDPPGPDSAASFHLLSGGAVMVAN